MNQIKIGSIVSYITILINVIIGLVYTPWVIKTIGKADYGLYTLATSVIALFVMDFGLGNAVTRFVSKYIAEGNDKKAKNLLGLVYKLYIFIDIIILIVLLIVFFNISQIYRGLTPEEIEKFKVVFAISAVYSVISFPFIPLSGIMFSYEKFVQLKLFDLCHKLLIVLLMSWCLYNGYGLYALVSVNVIAGLVVVVSKILFVKYCLPIHVNWHFWDKVELKEVTGYSVWVTAISLSQRFVVIIAPSILGIISDSKAITILGLAITLEAYSFTFTNALSGMFLPRLSRFVANGEDNEIMPLMIRIGRIQLLIISLVMIGFISVGRQFVDVWLGNDFQEVYLSAILLMMPAVVHTTQQVGSDLIMVKGLVKKQAKYYLLMAGMNLILSFPLTWMLGVYGMCLSICVAYFTRTIGNNVIFHRDIKLSVSEFFRETFGKMYIPIVFAAIVSVMYCHFNPLHVSGWGGLFINALIILIIYSLFTYLLAMNNYEKNLVKSMVQTLKK